MRKIVERSMLGHAWITAGDQDLPFVGEEELLRHILVGRGIAESDIQHFLNPSVREYMPDPFVLRDMQAPILMF